MELSRKVTLSTSYTGCVFPHVSRGQRRQTESKWNSVPLVCKMILQVLGFSLILRILAAVTQTDSSETSCSLCLNDNNNNNNIINNNNNKAKLETCQRLLASSHYRTKYSLLEHAGSYADSTFLGDANAVKTTLSHRIKSHNSPKPNKDRIQPTQLWLPIFLVVAILFIFPCKWYCFLALTENLAFLFTKAHSWWKYWCCEK